MRVDWFRHYQELQRRALSKFQQLHSQIHQHSNFLQQKAFLNFRWDQIKYLEIAKRFLRLEHARFKKSSSRQLSRLANRSFATLSLPSSSILLALKNDLCKKLGYRRTERYLRVIRSPTYQKFERWWDTSPCPATVLILAMNSFIFFLW